MSSINLLPQNNIKGKRESEEKDSSNIPMILSFLMIIIVSLSVVALFFYNKDFSDMNSALDLEAIKIDQSLEDATKNNELLLAESVAKDDTFLLSTHPYYSKVIDFIQNNLQSEVYLNLLEIGIGPQDVNITMEANTKDYLAVSSQISIFKRAKLVNSVVVGSISLDNGLYLFPALIQLKKEAILYNNGESSGEEEKIAN